MRSQERRLSGGSFVVARVLVPLGWALAAVGYFGPWVAHATAALTLSGADMGEFVKFLPGVADGSLLVMRQAFYLPPLAVVISVALLIGSRQLRYGWPMRLVALVLSVPLSLQLLPPAWSPASLMTPEFRLQAIALGVCWLLLAGFWLWGRLPVWLVSALSAGMALATGALASWQLAVVKPAVDTVYGTAPALGWGFLLCIGGLVVIAVASVILMWRTGPWSGRPWIDN